MKADPTENASTTPGEERPVATVATVKSKRIPRSRSIESFEIVVVEGRDTGLRLSLRIDEATRVLVGQSALCGLRVADPAVGARHCCFEVADRRLRVTELTSGGTRVNGVLTKEAFLSGGEVVRIGDTVLSVQTGRRGAAAARVGSFGRIAGESAAMRELYPVFASAAQGLGPVLVQGEAGVGKRLLAEELHRHAMADNAPFEATQRGMAPSDVAEVLFTPGGLLDRARGGTLYIAELRELDDAAQLRLAEILVEGRVRVIMATRGGPPDGSVIEALAAGFTGTRITLPPLREREADMLVLARRFWVDLGGEGGLPDDFAAEFHDHLWPGNVRELRVAVQRRVLHGPPGAATSDAEPPKLRAGATADALASVLERDLPFVDARQEVLAEFERRYVDHALERSGQSVARAAAASGIAHRYFQVLKSRRRRPA